MSLDIKAEDIIGDLNMMIKDPLGEGHTGSLTELLEILEGFLGTENNIFTPEEIEVINDCISRLSYYEEEQEYLTNYNPNDQDRIAELKSDISEVLKPFRLFIRRLSPKLEKRYEDYLEEIYREEENII